MSECKHDEAGIGIAQDGSGTFNCLDCGAEFVPVSKLEKMERERDFAGEAMTLSLRMLREKEKTEEKLRVGLDILKHDTTMQFSAQKIVEGLLASLTQSQEEER